MTALAQLSPAIVEDRFTSDVERWLSGDDSVNLAPDMYIGDLDDSRWVKGHSSPLYYVEHDEQATFALVKRDLSVQADNLFDLGVGGEKAVLEKGLAIARIIGAKNYFACDLAPALADDAAALAETTANLNAVTIICDIFGKLPVRKANSFVALLGLTLGNLETYQEPEAIHNRLREIFSNYADAVTSSNSQVRAKAHTGHLLISYDANQNEQQVRECYLNPEFGGLVRSCVDRAINTQRFDYDVVLRKTPDVLFVSTGLRSRDDQMISFNGNQYSIEKGQFLSVLNSSRFSTDFMTSAAVKAGWQPERIWSASGRVHYQHFTKS